MVNLGVGFAAETPRINSTGQVAGNVGFADGNSRAFFWTPASGMRDIGSLGSGQVVGESPPARGRDPHAFSWRPGGRMVDLGTFGGPRSYASRINRQGTIVGGAMLRDGSFHGFA